MTDNTYNGWTNRETWLVGLWFNPETKSDIHCINWDELREAQEDEEE